MYWFKTLTISSVHQFHEGMYIFFYCRCEVTVSPHLEHNKVSLFCTKEHEYKFDDLLEIEA